MTFKEALNKGILLLESEDILDAKIDAWLLLSFVSGITKAQYFLKQNEEIPENTLYKYKEVLLRRGSHVPLQHITGEQDFMGLTFWVNEHVLIPRQDTETLVEEALKVIPSGSHVLDLCTGSGCVIISLVALGQGLSGIGVDISEDALVVARENGTRIVGKKVAFEKGDLFTGVQGRFNAIVSNPPYIPTAVVEELAVEVKDHEPRLALDGTEDGLLFYRRITASAQDYLNEGGWLLVEIGYDQGQDVSKLFTDAGFKDVEVVQDLAGNDRVVKGHLQGSFDIDISNFEIQHGGFSVFDRLEDLVLRYEEVMNLLSEPDVANDNARFRALMKEQAELAPIVEAYKQYTSHKQNIEDSLALLDEETDEEMKELAKEELNESKAEVERLEQELKILLLPKDPNDDKNVIVEIRAGAGGEEAALFAAEIYRMYVHYVESRGWKVELLEADETGIGGMKNIEFMVKGTGAYSILKYESGVHRVQRVPETESQGRIQTSTCSVAVMPEAEEVDIQIEEKDIRIDVMRASGNGGQCVNTTDSAVRLTHYPTGIVIYSQTEKSQLQNKEKAFALLRAKLYDLELQKQQDAEAAERRSQIGTGDRAEKIRTYNFPQGRVTDHRINLTLYKLDKIMDGDIQEILDALIAADQAAKLAKMNEK